MARRMMKKITLYIKCISISLALCGCAVNPHPSPVVVEQRIEQGIYPSNALLDLCLVNSRITSKDVPSTPNITATQVGNYIIKLENSYEVCRDVVKQVSDARPKK